jgi:hypothetical protein
MAMRRAATAASSPISVQIPRVIADKTRCSSQTVTGRISQTIITTASRERPLLTALTGIMAASRLAASNDTIRVPLNFKALKTGAATIVRRTV